MSVSSALRNLRSGPVILASGANDSTVRAWIAKNGLILGDRESRTSGNPRYDLADAARLQLMQMLTAGAAKNSADAAALVNAVRGHIAVLADAELAAMDAPEAADFSPHYVVVLETMDLRHFEIVTAEELTARDRSDGNRSVIIDTRIDLRELVRLARDILCSVVGVSLSGLRHDFAKAA